MRRRDQHIRTLTHRSCQARMGLVLGACAWLAATSAAQAQDAASGRGLSVSANVQASVTSTADRRADGRNGSDVISQLRPSFFLSSRSGRVVGSLSYSMGLTHHQKAFDGENIHNQLNAVFSAEAIERWAYLDVSATISQQAASAYGQQTAADSTRYNSNRVEVGSLNISPYVRGVLGGAVNYEVRLNANGTNGRRSIAADSSSVGESLSLSSVIPGAMIGWGLTANRAKQDYRAGRESTNSRYSASLSFMPDPDLTLDARGGQESNDVASISQTSYNNWGAGLTWRPSPRTRARFQYDDRYFGRGHQILIEHKLASSSVQFSSFRDANNGAGTASQPVTLYQFLGQQLAAQYPDPAERDARIRASLGNLDPGLLVGGGAIRGAVSITQRNQFVASYGGPRLSGSMQIYSTSSHNVDVIAAAEDTKQWGYLGSLSYRLTPTAGVTLTGSRMLTQGTDTRAGTELKSATLSWSDQLGRRTSASVSLRYGVFNSTTNPYREGAITASLSQRF